MISWHAPQIWLPTTPLEAVKSSRSNTPGVSIESEPVPPSIDSVPSCEVSPAALYVGKLLSQHVVGTQDVVQPVGRTL